VKKLIPYLLLIPLLSGCSALSAIGGLLPDSGVNANAQIGAENNQAVAQVGDELSSGDNSTVTKADQANAVEGTQIINSETPWWMIGLVALLAGWAIPTPMVMAIGIVNFFRIIFGKKPLRYEQ
jgi:hypothetical protein